MRTLHGEARSESIAGRIAVMHCILNRAMRPTRFGTSVTAVCLAPRQFSCWNKNDPNRVIITALRPGSMAYRDIETLVRTRWNAPDTVGGACHYFNPAVVLPTWARGGRETARIGGHLLLANFG